MINALKYWGARLIHRYSDRLRHLIERTTFRTIAHRVSCEIGFDVSTIFSHTHPSELAALYQMAAALPPGANVLEIGSHLGKSACFLGAALRPKGGKLYCVDTWQNENMPEAHCDTFPAFQCNTGGLGTVIIPIRKHSAQLAPGDIPSPLHLVFIDGDHAYEAVRSDLQNVVPLIPIGGIVAFHDAVGLSFPDVARVIGEALAGGQWAIGGQSVTLFWLRRMKSD